jgi:2-polyprenyl-3-methyl-5-hydroxy-6-metoxy-1,4-benzoquinol methylase
MNSANTVARYQFEKITACEMCGDDTGKHKILGQRMNQTQGTAPKRRSGIAVTVMKCRNCGLVYSNPMPVPLNIQDHYGTAPESYWPPEYFQLSSSYFQHEIRTVKELLTFSAGMKALDVGAGIGKCMIALKNAGFDVFGLEPSSHFYERAIADMGIDPDRLKLGMIEEVTYSPNSFDFINFGAVFEHLYHPAAALRKAMSWLKPGGIIHIEVPSSKHFVSRLFNLYYRIRGTNYVTNLSPMHVPFHMYEFSLESFKELGKKLDFSVERHQYDVCDIVHIPRIFHPPLRKYMQWTNTGMQLTLYIKKKNT